jgi:hypothetical protein
MECVNATPASGHTNTKPVTAVIGMANVKFSLFAADIIAGKPAAKSADQHSAAKQTHNPTSNIITKDVTEIRLRLSS